MSKKRKRITAVISIIICALAVVCGGISYFIGTQVMEASTQLVTPEDTTGMSDGFWEKYGVDYEEFCETYTIETVRLTSTFDGHMIPAEFIFDGETKQDTMILVHGLGGNRYANYPLAELFLENGFNVLTYDQRSSNENTAEKTTFGYWEKYDLLDCLDYVKERTGSGQIGVWGTSFGGATALQAAAYENTQDELSFLILDCPVSSMKWMIETELKNMDAGVFTPYMTWCGNLVNKLKLGFSYEDADAAEAAKSISIPTMVINSEADELTPYFMGKDIYDNLQSDQKELWTVPDSEHTEQWLDHNEEYRTKVLGFIRGFE